MNKLHCIILIVSALALTSCTTSPTLDYDIQGAIDRPFFMETNNLTVVRVEPNGHVVAVDYKGYNIRLGGFSKPSFETIEFRSGSEIYVVSNRYGGNNRLLVNDEFYGFNHRTQCVLIDFGVGVSIVEMPPDEETVMTYDLDDYFESNDVHEDGFELNKPSSE